MSKQHLKKLIYAFFIETVSQFVSCLSCNKTKKIILILMSLNCKLKCNDFIG